MKKPLVLAAYLLPMATMPLAAQGADPVAPLVAQAMFGQTGGKYVAPKCSADKNKHFKVSSGATYLSSAISTGYGPKADNLLEQGVRVTTEAITTEGQEKAPSAWYTLGRIQLFQGNIAGGDSSLKKAEALAPDCKSEIDLLRRIAFVPLVTEAQKQADAKNSAAAAGLYRRASAIYPSSPFASYNLATLYAEQKQADSAVKYFQAAAKSTSTDTNDVKVRKLAEFNAAVLMINSGRAAEAVPMLESYVQANPNDQDAKRGLAQAYRATGQTEKARALDAQTGVSTASGPSENTALKDVMAAFNAKDYPTALQKSEAALAGDPNNTTALTAAAFSAYQLKDGPNLVKYAEKLNSLEPANEDALKLLSNGYKLTKQVDKATGVGEKILSLPMHVSMTGLTLSATGANLNGVATGREALDAKTTKPLTPQAHTLVFEFIDKAGTAVASQEVAVPALAKDQKHEFTLDAKGEGITGYRYKLKT
jgi:tetratricopeptide (TPR) repeat protein